nr:hypothetical protein ANI_1_1938184 [Aspergillus niger CBS 513.88]|eukprot:XP_001401962.2 hypothetical protein ANI_1_1938184 [Aspergillus niger CBS 513.88]
MASSSFLKSPSPLDLPPTTSTSNPLYVTIRFSASIPDLPLDIFSPETTTSAGLKQLIRTRLPPHLSSHRLRLIHAGRGLEDKTPLSVSLKLPPTPTRSPRPSASPPSDTTSDPASDPNRKGKAPVRDHPRLYIHCSIGDIVLSATDLATEASIASTLDDEQHSSSESNHDDAGFTPAEVAGLRSQFLAVQSVSRTPDTMPSGAELRELEDRWMDEGSTAAMAAGGGGGDGAVSFADDDGGFGAGSRGAMDDMLWGAVMGFFWPVGCAMWLRREEGVWSWRKGLAVFVGVVVNIAFGAMRIMN